jgi:hypothetical protein
MRLEKNSGAEKREALCKRDSNLARVEARRGQAKHIIFASIYQSIIRNANDKTIFCEDVAIPARWL